MDISIRQLLKFMGKKKKKRLLLVKDMITQLIPQHKARPLNYAMESRGNGLESVIGVGEIRRK